MLPAATQVSQRRPESTRNGIVKTICPICVFDGVGRTLRLVRTAGVAISSSMAARARTVGFSYRSATVTSG